MSLGADLHTLFFQQLPFGLEVWQAATVILMLFTAGAIANAGRAMLMRMAGM
jgi:hypothetical protein